MKRNIRLSIITVCYNAKSEIEKTIKSIIPFINDDVEYVIVDGGSEDGTLEVINKYREYISVLISEKDAGIYDAMNKGLRASSGMWAIFINCGDILLDIPKDIFLDGILSYDCAVASVRIDKGEVVNPRISRLLYIKNTIPHQGLFYNLTRQNIEFDTKYKIFADHDLNIKLYKGGCSYIRLKNVVAFHSLGGISSDKNKAKREMFYLRRQYGGIPLMFISLLYYKYQGFKCRIKEIFD